MNAEEFVQQFVILKESLIQEYFDTTSDTEVFDKIDKLDLDFEKEKILQEILDDVLTDALYTILLGLDGEAQIGDSQETYDLSDENGNKLTGSGEIEAYAWENFHGLKHDRK